MKALKIADIIEATHGTLLCGDKERKITNVLTDSRKIEDGCLFVALSGETDTRTAAAVKNSSSGENRSNLILLLRCVSKVFSE